MSTNYIRDFLRLLRRGGVAVFQVPAADLVSGEATARPDRASTTLPSTAYAAALEPERRFFSAAPGARVPLQVKVTNRGAAVWPAAGDDESGMHSVRVANRWRNLRGRLLPSGESRAVLPADLPPGEQCTVGLVLLVPEAVGWYLAEIDMVHEGVAWFAEHSSKRARALVRVTNSLADGCFSRVPLRMQMYGISRDTVVALVESAGGRVLDVMSDDAAGAEWKSFTYYVEKL